MREVDHDFHAPSLRLNAFIKSLTLWSGGGGSAEIAAKHAPRREPLRTYQLGGRGCFNFCKVSAA